MNYITAPLLGLLVTLLNLICPLLVLLALPFAKWDAEPSAALNVPLNIIRGDLPGWLLWLSTPSP